MSKLGITIRKGASGFTLSSPEGAFDLSSLNRAQLGEAAATLSEALGLEQRHQHQPRRRTNQRRHNRNHSRKD